MQLHFSRVLLAINHVQQRAAGECLAACAAMVCDYLGATIAYQRLLKLLHIQPFAGTPFSNIRQLGQLGISVTYQAGTLDDLHRYLLSGLPCITAVQTYELPYWNNVSSLHAVVVVGMHNDTLYLHDPELPDGPVQISAGDFDLAWLEQGEMYAVLTL